MEFLFSAAGQSAAGTKVIYYSTLPESLTFLVQTLRCEIINMESLNFSVVDHD